MDHVRPLHQVFAELADAAPGTEPGDLASVPAQLDLPDDLLTEALISFADTAPAEVAAHLAPFVTAHSPITPGAALPADVAHGVELLRGAPIGLTLGEPYVADGLDDGAMQNDLGALDELDGWEGVGGEPEVVWSGHEPATDVPDLVFGQGGAPAEAEPFDPGHSWLAPSGPDLGWSLVERDASGLDTTESPSDELGLAAAVPEPDGGFGTGNDEIDDLLEG
ncbi:MAG: hypothetical protein IPK24_05160 [Kineosporiaceae bacterium]|nr:hypothetical protein [Kineosporiaceae bacterium]MBK8074960.1 hypothetical protein [Kineosporiaceae bacterium]